MSKAIPFTTEHEQLLYSSFANLKEHTAILDEHSAKLDEHTAKLDEHSVKLDEHSVKLDEHSTKLDNLTVRLDNLTVKVDEGFRRVDVLLEHQNSKLDTVMELLLHRNEKLNKQDHMEEILENHEHRLAAMENVLGKTN